MPPYGGIQNLQSLVSFGVLTLLIGNAATGLAGRLAGSLALAASAVFDAVAQVAFADCFDMFHHRILPKHL